MHSKTLVYQLQLSHKIVEMNTGGVSHEESLVTPPKGGSCLNQVVGHLTRTRNMALGTMGQKSPYPMEEFDPYDDRTGVPFSPENALPFDELRCRFKAMQEPLVRAINAMSPDGLASRPPKNMTGDPNETVGSNLATFVFHECYHVGQTGVLRRVAGKPGVVKPPGHPVPFAALRTGSARDRRAIATVGPRSDVRQGHWVSSPGGARSRLLQEAVSQAAWQTPIPGGPKECRGRSPILPV